LISNNRNFHHTSKLKEVGENGILFCREHFTTQWFGVEILSEGFEVCMIDHFFCITVKAN